MEAIVGLQAAFKATGRGGLPGKWELPIFPSSFALKFKDIETSLMGGAGIHQFVNHPCYARQVGNADIQETMRAPL